MKLDKFKLKAIQNSIDLPYEYSLRSSYISAAYYEYVISFKYNDVELFIEIKRGFQKIINAEVIKAHTLNAIQEYERVSESMQVLDKIKYLDNLAKVIFSEIRNEEGGLFASTTINEIEGQIDNLLDTYKNDFKTVYKILTTHTLKEVNSWHKENNQKEKTEI